MRKTIMGILITLGLLVLVTAGAYSLKSIDLTPERQLASEPVCTVGLISQGLESPYCTVLAEGAEEAAKGQNIKLIVKDGQFDITRQVMAMEAFITQRVDVIILQPQESAPLIPLIQRARSLGIPTISIGMDIETDRVAYIGPSDIREAYGAGKMLAEVMGGKGNVVLFEGEPGGSCAKLRTQGFEMAISEYPGIKIIARQPANWLREKAYHVMKDFMGKYQKIDGVFGSNEDMAFGALKAAREAGRAGEMKIVGIDGSKEAMDSIRRGGPNELWGTVGDSPWEHGMMAVSFAMWLVTQKNPDLWDKLEGTIYARVFAADQTNIGEFSEEVGF